MTDRELLDLLLGFGGYMRELKSGDTRRPEFTHVLTIDDYLFLSQEQHDALEAAWERLEDSAA